MLFELKKRI